MPAKLSERAILLGYSQGERRWREAALLLGLYSYEKLDARMRHYKLRHPDPDAKEVSCEAS